MSTRCSTEGVHSGSTVGDMAIMPLMVGIVMLMAFAGCDDRGAKMGETGTGETGTRGEGRMGAQGRYELCLCY